LININSPQKKLCAGLLTWKTIKTLEEIFKTDLNYLKSQGVINYQSEKYAIYNQKGELIRGKPEKRAVSFDIQNSEVETDKGNIFKARFILGTDGVLSKTRNALNKAGLIRDKWSAGLATALETFIPKQECPAFPDHPIIYFGYIPWGYAWSFPGAENQILGICGLNRKVKGRFKECFYNFLKTQPVSKKQL
jgi:flavin-dependent dehydrogenase